MVIVILLFVFGWWFIVLIVCVVVSFCLIFVKLVVKMEILVFKYVKFVVKNLVCVIIWKNVFMLYVFFDF